MATLTTLLSTVKHVIGRALRETGQALDRLGIRGKAHATSMKRLGDDTFKFQDHLSRHRNFMPLLLRGTPYVEDGVAFIAPCSSIIGMVHIGTRSSIWYGTIIRADRGNRGLECITNNQEKWARMYKGKREVIGRDYAHTSDGGGIYIGKETIIRDGCVITSDDGHTIIGNGVTVGHMSNINSSTVEDNCLIGMGTVLSMGSWVETLSVIAPGTVVGKDVIVKSGELWSGNPARKLRDLTDKEKRSIVYQRDEHDNVSKKQKHVMNLGGNIPAKDFSHVEVNRKYDDNK